MAPPYRPSFVPSSNPIGITHIPHPQLSQGEISKLDGRYHLNVPITLGANSHILHPKFEDRYLLILVKLELLKDYPKVVLGDREFCSVDLAKWLSSHRYTYFSLRLKKNTCIEIEAGIWQQLQDLGLSPGMSVYHQGVKVTKTKGFGPFNLAAKWKRTYRGWAVEEAWFLRSEFVLYGGRIKGLSEANGD